MPDAAGASGGESARGECAGGDIRSELRVVQPKPEGTTTEILRVAQNDDLRKVCAGSDFLTTATLH